MWFLTEVRLPHRHWQRLSTFLDVTHKTVGFAIDIYWVQARATDEYLTMHRIGWRLKNPGLHNHYFQLQNLTISLPRALPSGAKLFLMSACLESSLPNQTTGKGLLLP